MAFLNGDNIQLQSVVPTDTTEHSDPSALTKHVFHTVVAPEHSDPFARKNHVSHSSS